MSVSKGKAVAFGQPRKLTLWEAIKRHPWMYLFLVPGLVFLIIFQYIPMYGILIAFEKFSLTKGIFNSQWIGLENFQLLFRSNEFKDVFRNSIALSILRLLCGFPAPIILALMINEVQSTFIKRTVQTIVYLPHFVSWVVIANMVTTILSPAGGIVNTLITNLGGKSINFIISPKYFRAILIISEIWKESGWGTIIYLASISGIDPMLYEAARIDGANRWHQALHVTLPCICNTIVVVLILRMGSILNNGFDQIYLLYSPAVYEVADVFETYTYRVGFLEGRYSYSAAVGLFQSLVGLIMILITNKAANALGESGLW